MLSYIFTKKYQLYHFLKIPAKLAFLFYCRWVKINNKEFLAAKGPLLIASNHPNSFLDAVIFATLFKRPVYSLTRGDMYSNPLAAKFLTAMKMLPVYRTSEGPENMNENYKTFNKCKDIFKKNGIVLIFSEGLCINEWHLRPLKKGTARLALSSWEEGIPLKILPSGINYQAFKLFGKNVEINFGDILNEEDIDHTNGYGKTIKYFNEKLRNNLQPLVAEIDAGNERELKKRFYIHQGWLKRIILFMPAIAGWALHALPYSIVQQYTWSKAGDSGHYDSILIALLFICYPLYLGIVAFAAYYYLPGAWWLTV
ncbi:MAG: 1-acyl-sn-glycerol-3-phosphate acyltransferase, partial [Ferruginibacter sp.]